MDGERVISFGTPGMADIGGISSPHGRAVFIECKSGKAKLSKKQSAFKEMIKKFGGIYIEARSVEDVANIIDNL